MPSIQDATHSVIDQIGAANCTITETAPCTNNLANVRQAGPDEQMTPTLRSLVQEYSEVTGDADSEAINKLITVRQNAAAHTITGGIRHVIADRAYTRMGGVPKNIPGLEENFNQVAKQAIEQVYQDIQKLEEREKRTINQQELQDIIDQYSDKASKALFAETKIDQKLVKLVQSNLYKVIKEVFLSWKSPFNYIYYENQGNTKTNEEVVAKNKANNLFLLSTQINRWRDSSTPFLEQNGIARLQAISSANIDKLQRNLGSLNEQEQAFIKRFLASKFYITHATDAVDKVVTKDSQTLQLYSLQKLLDSDTPCHAASFADAYTLGNIDFVFFSLEASETHNKFGSRFGGVMFRISFDGPAFDVAWLSLTEMLNFPGPKQALRQLCNGLVSRGLSEEGLAQFWGSLIAEFEGERYMPSDLPSRLKCGQYDIVFFGKDMKYGLALNIIKVSRNLEKEVDRKLFLEHDIDQLINGLFRPEVKVPRHFFAKDGTYEKYAIKKGTFS